LFLLVLCVGSLEEAVVLFDFALKFLDLKGQAVWEFVAKFAAETDEVLALNVSITLSVPLAGREGTAVVLVLVIAAGVAGETFLAE